MFSELKPITKGVPLGSILGALLCIAYINDLIRIYPHAKYVLYADDVSMFVSAEDSGTLQEKMNQILVKIKLWSRFNNLNINTGKTKAVLFTISTKK